MERIQEVLGNLVQTYNIKDTYIDNYGPWLIILAATTFVICYTKNGLKCYSRLQLVFGPYIILPIKNIVDWELIRQRNHAQINKYSIRENSKIVYHGY